MFFFKKEKTLRHKLIIFSFISFIIEEKKSNSLISLDPEIFV